MTRQRFWTTQRDDEATMTLPAMPGGRQRVASPTPAVVSQAIASQHIGKTVWMIDDSPTVRAVAAFHLRQVGITVCSFEDGVKALAHLRQRPQDAPPLILLDVEMPRMNGYDVARSLRAFPCCAWTAIVMVSARDKVVDRLKGRLVGASDYLTKPFTYGSLLAMVLAYLNPAVPEVPETKERVFHA